MDWQALHSFRIVARERSFTRAAALLFVSPSTLSHRIRRLEKDWGVPLLTRTTRRVSTTRGGEALLAAVEKIEIALVEARQKVADMTHATTGPPFGFRTPGPADSRRGGTGPDGGHT
ncbi:LysR family transcriptional regulator [Micromonospora sp. AKA38]|uniref:LysR family transcriptional regulator n=1 Tax=Micromonospora sp. AKA38 TaxID=2733861 RepID=UPI0022C2D1B4|nr:LysR family transcriptional regulator [Micromonospora sp. AKA38]GHJ16153.1 hypothetical protein TPA0908_41480 [Micromonospora sp. AKA38]